MRPANARAVVKLMMTTTFIAPLGCRQNLVSRAPPTIGPRAQPNALINPVKVKHESLFRKRIQNSRACCPGILFKSHIYLHKRWPKLESSGNVSPSTWGGMCKIPSCRCQMTSQPQGRYTVDSWPVAQTLEEDLKEK